MVGLESSPESNRCSPGGIICQTFSVHPLSVAEGNRVQVAGAPAARL